MTHTPGPWKAQGGKVTNLTGSHLIADFGSLAKGPNPEVEGNATLGAAAPDLARELERMVQLVRHALAHPGYGRDDNSACEAESYLEDATAALAKAGVGR